MIAPEEGRKALEAAGIAVMEVIGQGAFGDVPDPRTIARAAIKAYLANLPGCEISPVTPTDAMVRAGLLAIDGDNGPEDVFSAMISAAPLPPGLEDSSE